MDKELEEKKARLHARKKYLARQFAFGKIDEKEFFRRIANIDIVGQNTALLSRLDICNHFTKTGKVKL